METCCGYGYDQEWLDTRLRTVSHSESASFGFQGSFVLALAIKDSSVKLRCSSRFRTISRGEPNSMVLWSIMNFEWFPTRFTTRIRPNGHSFRNSTLNRTRIIILSSSKFLTVKFHLNPFEEMKLKSVKRKRDLFPGSRTTSQWSV